VPLELAAEICAAYIRCMVLRSSRGRPLNAPAAFIHPCRKAPPPSISWQYEKFVLINVKKFVAILLIAAVPAYAQAQSRNTSKVSKGDAQKVATIIKSDKAKVRTYCEINEVSEEMNQVYGKNDKKRLDELSQKIERLEKILGPEYVALMDGLQKLGPENSKGVTDILLQFAALDRLCRR